MVLELFGLAVLSGGNQVPHEALDLVVTTVMHQAVGEQGTADHFHVALAQRSLEAPMQQDVLPTPPPSHHNTSTHKDRDGEQCSQCMPMYVIAIFLI